MIPWLDIRSGAHGDIAYEDFWETFPYYSSNSKVAVARGEAIRGLGGKKSTSRRLRRYYGFALGIPFYASDPSSKLPLERWYQQYYCSDNLQRKMHKEWAEPTLMLNMCGTEVADDALLWKGLV